MNGRFSTNKADRETNNQINAVQKVHRDPIAEFGGSSRRHRHSIYVTMIIIITGTINRNGVIILARRGRGQSGDRLTLVHRPSSIHDVLTATVRVPDCAANQSMAPAHFGGRSKRICAASLDNFFHFCFSLSFLFVSFLISVPSRRGDVLSYRLLRPASIRTSPDWPSCCYITNCAS